MKDDYTRDNVANLMESLSNGGTVTTLQVKQELRNFGFVATQAAVSRMVDSVASDLGYQYEVTPGGFREYYKPTAAPVMTATEMHKQISDALANSHAPVNEPSDGFADLVAETEALLAELKPINEEANETPTYFCSCPIPRIPHRNVEVHFTMRNPQQTARNIYATRYGIDPSIVKAVYVQ